tara:strand:- start:129 stop:437 length:309 start_codon:yes stop_codon:yes gene_type:complete
MFQRFKDAMEGRAIKRHIGRLLCDIYFQCYHTMEEATELTTKVYNLIEEAKKYNVRTNSKPIAVDPIEQQIGVLELKIEDRYFEGTLPIEQEYENLYLRFRH